MRGGFFLLVFSLGILFSFFQIPGVLAAMTSTNYQIQWDVLSQGGSDTGSSSSFLLRDTIGGAAVGSSSGSTQTVRAGYRQGIFDQVTEFEIGSMDASSEVSASSLSSTTVTVSNTTGFSVGEFILLVQNHGGSEVDAVGKVLSLTSTTLTVDEWKNAGTPPSIDGANDYVYSLENGLASFGTLSASAVSSTVVGWNVSTDAANGYTVYVHQSGAFSNGPSSISGVSDGSVTAGQSEYGGRSSDTSLASSTFDTADTAFSTSDQALSTQSTDVYESRDFLVLKVAISSSQPAGNYTHNLSFIAVPNF